MLQILRLATPQKSHPDKTPTDPQIEMEYLDKDLISEQVSDLRFGHQKCPFWEWEKATFTAFPHSRKGTSGAWNENLRPTLKSGLWRGDVVMDMVSMTNIRIWLGSIIESSLLSEKVTSSYRMFSQTGAPGGYRGREGSTTESG